jgi:hypothetical protein
LGQAPQLLRAVLGSLGRRYALDYDTEMFTPGRSREARAYRFLQAGAWLLVLYVEPDDFPATKRRARKRGAKRLAKSFHGEGAGRATIFLTQAMGIYVLEAMNHAGESESAEAHASLIELVQSHYPLPSDDRDLLEAAGDRLRNLETSWQAMPPLEEGASSDLKQGRLWAAQDAFRTSMDLEGIRIAIGDQEMEALAEHLRYPGADISYDGLARSRADARWWTDAAETWSEAAKAALS